MKIMKFSTTPKSWKKLEVEPPTVNETQSDAKWNEPKPDNSKDRAQRLMRR